MIHLNVTFNFFKRYFEFTFKTIQKNKFSNIALIILKFFKQGYRYMTNKIMFKVVIKYIYLHMHLHLYIYLYLYLYLYLHLCLLLYLYCLPSKKSYLYIVYFLIFKKYERICNQLCYLVKHSEAAFIVLTKNTQC